MYEGLILSNSSLLSEKLEKGQCIVGVYGRSQGYKTAMMMDLATSQLKGPVNVLYVATNKDEALLNMMGCFRQIYSRKDPTQMKVVYTLNQTAVEVVEYINDTITDIRIKSNAPVVLFVDDIEELDYMGWWSILLDYCREKNVSIFYSNSMRMRGLGIKDNLCWEVEHPSLSDDITIQVSCDRDLPPSQREVTVSTRTPNGGESFTVHHDYIWDKLSDFWGVPLIEEQQSEYL